MAAGSERVILVTGSRRGIGRAIVTHYLDHGDTVFGLSRTDSDLRHDLYRHLVADVRDEAAVRAAYAEIARETSRLDVLINCAGAKLGGYALLTGAAQAAEMFATNLLGAFIVSREAVKLMKRRRFGRVISFSSVAVPLGSPGSTVYGASKAGLEQLAYGLSRELKDDDITFNTIGISIFADSGMAESLGDRALAEANSALIKPGALAIEEIVHAVDFFAAPAARHITNQVVYFGGLR